jgi:hypothetical protein
MSIVDTNKDNQISYEELLAFGKANAGGSALFSRFKNPQSLITGE